MPMRTDLTEEKIYCLTSMCQCSFSSSYKLGGREIDSFSTHVGSQSVVNQPKQHVTRPCFLPSDTSSAPREQMRQREREGEIAMGLRSQLSRQIGFGGGGCTFPQ